MTKFVFYMIQVNKEKSLQKITLIVLFLFSACELSFQHSAQFSFHLQEIQMRIVLIRKKLCTVQNHIFPIELECYISFFFFFWHFPLCT